MNADGSLSESFYPGAVTLNGLDGAVRDELLMIFPEFADMPTVKMRPAARVLRHFEARTLFAAQNSEQVVAWQRALPSRAPTRPGAGAPPNQRRSAGR